MADESFYGNLYGTSVRAATLVYGVTTIAIGYKCIDDIRTQSGEYGISLSNLISVGLGSTAMLLGVALVVQSLDR